MSFNYYKHNWDKRYLYKNASDFLKKYSSIPKVEEIKTKLNKDYILYRDEIEEFFNRAIPVTEELEKEERSIWRAERLLKKIGIGLIIVFFLCALMSTDYFFRSNLLFTIFWSFIPYCILATGIGIIYFKIKEKTFYKKQKGILAGYESEAKRINARTRWIEGIYDEVDRLYLATLEPAHREAVLMRRDQERQHREMMSAQRRHNQAMLDEQRRILQTQEEILQIEREREERYKRNSY